MRALITGCAGFIGSHLSEVAARRRPLGPRGRLLHRQLRAVAQAREPRARAPARRVRARAGRPRRGARSTACVADCDAVFHLAAEPGRALELGASASSSTCAATCMATQRLLDAASAGSRRSRSCSRPRRRSTARPRPLPTARGRRPRPYSPYGATKLAAENLCRLYHDNHGVRTVALRYFTVYGPRQRPDMAFHRFCRAAIERRAADGLRRRQPDPRLHLRRRHRRAPRVPRGRACPTRRAAPTTSAAARGSACARRSELPR